MFEISKATDLN